MVLLAFKLEMPVVFELSLERGDTEVELVVLLFGLGERCACCQSRI